MSLRDEILSQLDIVTLVSRYVQIKKAGKNRIGLCPFHKENTPSFTVAEDKQIFKCFGCGKGGNAITFHMEIERLDFRDSVTTLADELHIDISQYQKNPEAMSKKQSQREKMKLLNKRAQKFFTNHFTSDSLAATYMREKRELSEETIEHFGIGYAPNDHYEMITFLKEKGFSSLDLVEAGLAKKGQSDDLYTFFRQRVTFPIIDHAGNIVGFGARALDADQSPKYLNTTETPLYDKSKILYGLHTAKQHISKFNMLIVVEGYMDVIALYQYGFPIGIATCGTALTVEHTKLLQRYTDKVIFAFDQDKAGFEATVRGLKVAYANDLYPSVFSFSSEFKDIDEYLHGHEGEITPETIQSNTQEGFSFVLQELLRRHDINNPVDRKKCLNVIFDMMLTIEDYSVLLLYMEKLATVLRADRQLLLKQFKGFMKTNRVGQRPRQETTQQSGAPSMNAVVHALFDETFLAQRNVADHEDLKKQIDLLQELTEIFPDTKPPEVQNDENSESTSNLLHEAQLRREQRLDNLPSDKVYHHLLEFTHKQIHTLHRRLVKAPLDPERKQSLLDQIRSSRA